jgi:hypothetical protein
MASNDKDKGKARKAFPAKNEKPADPETPPAVPALERDLPLMRPIRRKSS